MLIHGGKKRYNKKGGCGSCTMSPADYDGVSTLPNAPGANYAGRPPFQTTQVGGDAYGYLSGADAAKYNGSYFPQSRIPATATDPSRGGNNFMAGGKKRTYKKKRMSKKKRTSKKYGGKKRTSKKWMQKGCKNVMKGGLIFV